MSNATIIPVAAAVELAARRTVAQVEARKPQPQERTIAAAMRWYRAWVAEVSEPPSANCGWNAATINLFHVCERAAKTRRK